MPGTVLKKVGFKRTAPQFPNAKTHVIRAANSPMPVALSYVVNVTILIDRSKSMPAEALDYMMTNGVWSVVATLREASRKNGYRYLIRLVTFSSSVNELMPFTDVTELNYQQKFDVPAPSGVTCTEKALREAFDEIDRIKSKQDRTGIPRAGSMLVLITDGRPTNENGKVTPLAPAMQAEIASRNQSRKTTMVAFGFGKVDQQTLKLLAPPSQLTTAHGATHEAPHALLYKDPSYQDISCWQALSKLIGTASSSSSGEIMFAYDTDTLPFGVEDVIDVDPAVYTIVK